MEVRQAGSQTGWKPYRQEGRLADWWADRLKGRQGDKQTGWKADRAEGRLAGRQASWLEGNQAVGRKSGRVAG